MTSKSGKKAKEKNKPKRRSSAANGKTSADPMDRPATSWKTAINSGQLSASETLQLQRTIGNRAVDHLLGSKIGTSGGVIQREWDPKKCADGCPPATLTPAKVLAEVATSEPLFTNGATNKGKQSWIYTFYSGYQVVVDGWIISAMIHAHVTKNRKLVTGNIYIPGYKNWSTKTTKALLAKFPAYDATIHEDGWVDDAAAQKDFFSGSNRYPHKP